MKCKICNEEVTIRSMAMHLRWSHKIKTDEYVIQYGEFRDKIIKQDIIKDSSNLKCKICNEDMMHNRQLMYHITKKHNITQEDYIVKYYHNNIHPTCKCGCGNNTKFLRHGDIIENKPYFTDYIKGHWDWVKPGYYSHTEETKLQMRVSAIKRLENENKLYSGTSKGEEELLDFIKLNYKGIIEQGNKKLLSGLEIDILLPELNIGIEFNGSYYHSDTFRNKNYHLNKTNECKKLGIDLIHIWDVDWRLQKQKIQSILINKLGLTPTKIYARKCEIKEIDRKTSTKFLFDNHLQNSCISNHNIGLFYQNELISIITFGKLRKNLKQKHIENEFELLRFCNKLNVNVIGGASKLFTYFYKTYNPNKITTYANKDWSNGNLYEKLGFNRLKDTTPGYFYVKSMIKYNRFNFRKDILIKQGEDPNLTEYEIMIKNGYYRVWNTGNLKYEYIIK